MPPKSFTISVPCSSANIGPGFDCVGIGLSLRNEFRFTFGVPEYSVSSQGETAPDIDDPERNLVVKCYRDTARAYSIEPEPFRLDSINNIPFEGGMGSSATAILAGVAAARCRHGLSMDRLEILEDALREETHPDNLGACLYGGYIIAYVNEENRAKIYHAPIKKDLACWVIHPRCRVNTKQSRKGVSPQVPLSSVILNLGRCSMTTAALIQGQYEYLYDSLLDHIHEPGRMPPELELPALKKKLTSPDFYGWAISGSGPSILAFCRQVSAEMREQVREHFAARGREYDEFFLHVDNDGLLIDSKS